jgi:DNA-binding transcriptional LysR family regulator
MFMDTEKLKTFLRAIDTGSFTKAAEELGYTPSGVTHMMNALESELGIALLHRTRSGVTLTSAGRDLIGPLRELVAAADRLDQSVAEERGLTVGHVFFASGASFARYMLPEIAARFKARYPGITLEIMEAGGQEMRDAIAEHRISMGFLTRKESDRNFISLCSDDMLAIVPEGHPLADREEMDLQELAQYPYIGVNMDYDHDVESIVKERGFTAKPFLISRDEQAIIAMVREGLGVSIIAGLHVAFDSEGIVGIPLKPRYVRDVGLAIVSGDALSPAERRFIAVAREVVNEMIEDGLVEAPM